MDDDRVDKVVLRPGQVRRGVAVAVGAVWVLVAVADFVDHPGLLSRAGAVWMMFFSVLVVWRYQRYSLVVDTDGARLVSPPLARSGPVELRGLGTDRAWTGWRPSYVDERGQRAVLGLLTTRDLAGLTQRCEQANALLEHRHQSVDGADPG